MAEDNNRYVLPYIALLAMCLQLVLFADGDVVFFILLLVGIGLAYVIKQFTVAISVLKEIRGALANGKDDGK